MKRLAALTMAVAALTAACGSDDDGGTAADTTAAGADAPSEGFNEADVTFAQGMIPHHEQAVEMAELAAERAESDEVRELASGIAAAQDPEIETMAGWLEDWDETVEGGDDMSGDMSGEMEMGGMMSDEDMQMLEDAEGASFDQQFLEMMGDHHRGAIEMAETELSDGEFPDALALAQEIVDTQTAEIAEIEALLEA